ncbi:MAG: HAMP domain-containing histidine kinase [Ruminococcaceae bacterium]|nr:HAMP domain-containing histidine kinase [Oscillospiraceae bacterium]
MAGKRKRRSGSMFKWYFIQTSVSVLLCLTISSFAVMFFFLAFWKNDRLTAMNNDALSVAQSVELFVDENKNDLSEYKDSYIQLLQNIVVSASVTSGSEIFLVKNDGRILVCYDSMESDSDTAAEGTCLLHRYISFTEEIITGIKSSEDRFFNYEGTLSGFSDEKYLLSAASFEVNEMTHYVIVIQTETNAFLPYTTEFLRIMIFASIIAVSISCLLSLVISFRMVRPLKRINEATKHYAGGDFSARINTSDVYKELGQLVDSVNKMADSLSVLEESRSSFIANVSHELKTPMTIISGFIDGILDGTVSEEDQKRYLTIVSDEVKRLSRLVVAMLNMSKIEAGKLTLNKSTFSVRDIFIKTLLGFEKLIDEKNIRIDGFDTMENVTVAADETLINQIIYNLLDNAVKFTPEKGTITLSLYAEKKEAVFSVKNTGSGISQNECELVFDRFYKVDKSRGLDVKSFGMGLYIVKSIIELHKGTITLKTEPDEFTEFIIRIPLQ